MSIGGAARVDGGGWFRIHRLIVMPLLGPIIATVAIRTFTPVWNAHLWPFTVTQRETVRPVMVGVQYCFRLDEAWGENLSSCR